MPLNEIMGDVVDVSDVLEPLSIEKGKAVSNISGEEDVQRSYTYLTPNGTKVWCPISYNDSRPHVGATYGSWHDVITMYKDYAMDCGFSVRVGQTKRNKDDVITHKYLRCNKSGRPQSKRKFDTLAESSLHFRKSSYQVTDCKAHIGVQVNEATSTFYVYKFVECHNHPLVEPYNRDLTKAGRKLSFSTKQFIHHMTLNRIGPTIAHRLQVSMKGGHHNVKGTPTDFKNFSQAIRLFIGNLDSQLFLDRLRDRVQNLPEFYFDFCVVNERWGELICKFHLDDHVWLSDMYAIRSQWVPAYFRELPMCCLMKTTSRCESSNASFKVNSSGANTLVQFVLCYDTSIESQRYRQRLAEHKTSCRPFQNLTGLEIEKHAFEIYTRSLFLEVQKEIMKGKLYCYVSHTESVGENVIYSVTHLNKNNDVTNVFQVETLSNNSGYECSCRNFTSIGFLCRHVFCVFRVSKVNRIPPKYIAKRWTKDVLPKRIFDIEYRYGVDKSPQSMLRNEILDVVAECVDSLCYDPERLSVFATKVKELKSITLNLDSSDANEKGTNVADIQQLVGCGKRRRMKGIVEEAVKETVKAPRLCRTCKKYVTGHDSRNCKKKGI
ncbi:hypothetical protein E3N88_43971 [Mikania micrantha]|uniref:SWIM-type domain-containing protein n=1 Tax=Mikania micrantha TaxID=192012 RepID=A0A5N6LDJ6_9ASTR|nr:hypothetical protein E3N88_43971 [Mikania micrantha]